MLFVYLNNFIIIEEEAQTPFYFRPGLAWADVESPTIYRAFGPSFFKARLGLAKISGGAAANFRNYIHFL